MTNTNPKVYILLAAHNGEEYIEKQIDSILQQDYKNIFLLISDDGSNDETKDIIMNKIKFDNRISLIENPDGGTPRKNFNFLINKTIELIDKKQAESTYFMFSDQDDYWYPQKVGISLSKILTLEKHNDEIVPTMVYTNYYVTDGKDYKHLAYSKEIKNTNFTRVIMQSWCMGCTMIINRELLIAAGACPREANNHDEWISEIASLIGRIGFINNPTMEHLIHESNATTNIYTKKISLEIKRTLLRIKNRSKYIEKQHALVDILLSKMKNYPMAVRKIEEYNSFLKSRGLSTAYYMQKYDFKGVNCLQNFLFFIQISVK